VAAKIRIAGLRLQKIIYHAFVENLNEYRNPRLSFIRQPENS